ncbi:MAG: hypothetical protein ACMVP2_03700 [Imperialibacter sp.]|uniref:hypothetical protein n=1 Tax=Imperialibacter sp. TaxID=2038411 RepID=UPI003A8AF672
MRSGGRAIRCKSSASHVVPPTSACGLSATIPHAKEGSLQNINNQEYDLDNFSKFTCKRNPAVRDSLNSFLVKKNRILWVDDQPANNKPIADYMARQGGR